jgi:hypothetical protein
MINDDDDSKFRRLLLSKSESYTVKPVLNGISRVQNIFPLKTGFRLIKVYYDSHRA